jgi:hypothetical protein
MPLIDHATINQLQPKTCQKSFVGIAKNPMQKLPKKPHKNLVGQKLLYIFKH